MTAFYIGQHEIDDEAAFADYLKETMPFIEKHGTLSHQSRHT